MELAVAVASEEMLTVSAISTYWGSWSKFR
jgi:hypothetical protein